MIESVTITASLNNSIPYHFEIGENGQHDQIFVERPTEKSDTVLDLNDAKLFLDLNGDVDPGSYQLLSAGTLEGTATVQIPAEFANTLDTSRLFLDGTVMVLGTSLDCNGDGIVDVLDANCATLETLDALLAEVSLNKGDLDGSGEVDFGDFLTLSGNFGAAGDYTGGDIDLDGEVAFGDFLILASNFGKTSAVASVPEPNGTILIWLTLLGVVAFRRHCSHLEATIFDGLGQLRSHVFHQSTLRGTKKSLHGRRLQETVGARSMARRQHSNVILF